MAAETVAPESDLPASAVTPLPAAGRLKLLAYAAILPVVAIVPKRITAGHDASA